MKPAYHIAQINIARMKGQNINDPAMQDFVDQLNTINTLAESSEGFIWRLKSEQGNATDLNPYNDARIIVNFTVWESLDHLRKYVYESAHTHVMKDRKKWFDKFEKPSYVLWYTGKGVIPSIEEAMKRIEYFKTRAAAATLLILVKYSSLTRITRQYDFS
jgi:heme-degrading monooxygenase HmoA